MAGISRMPVWNAPVPGASWLSSSQATLAPLQAASDASSAGGSCSAQSMTTHASGPPDGNVAAGHIGRSSGK